MRAMGFRRNGGPEVLELVDVPVPQPGPGQVLVKVAYAGVNFAEIMVRRGSIATGQGLNVPGLEAAGHVVSLGAGVSGFEPGQPVAALTHFGAGASGGYAEYAVVPAALVYPLGELDLTTGAAFPVVVSTAYGLLTTGRLGEGDTVLIHAAVGGVGSVAAQIARVLGAGRVLGTVSTPAKAEYARQFGYDRVYLRDEFAERITEEFGARPLDVVLDSVAGPTRAASIELLAPLGRTLVYGNSGDNPDLQVSSNELWHRSRAVIGFSLGELATHSQDRLRRIALPALDILATGKVTVPIAEVVDLDKAADAHRLLESGASTGKILLRI
jgi:NADPH2:quinone reductase